MLELQTDSQEEEKELQNKVKNGILFKGNLYNFIYMNTKHTPSLELGQIQLNLFC